MGDVIPASNSGGGMSFFDSIAKDIGPLDEKEKAELAQFQKGGMKEEAKGLPVIAPKIEMLHQGAAAFKFVDAADENDQIKKSFNAILLHVDPQRAWWETGIGEKKEGQTSQTGQMPDCFSRDLIVPDPTSTKRQAERCDVCPHNQFGSDRKGGRGKDCKEARRVFVMVEGKLDPHVLTVPATSLKAMKKYFTFLAEKGIARPQFVLTKFSVITTENKEGTEYSELVLTYVNKIPEQVVMLALQAKRGLEEMLKTAVPIQKGDYAPQEPGSNG